MVWGFGQQPVHVYSAAQPKKLERGFRIGVWGLGLAFWFLVFGFWFLVLVFCLDLHLAQTAHDIRL